MQIPVPSAITPPFDPNSKMNNVMPQKSVTQGIPSFFERILAKMAETPKLISLKRRWNA